MIKPDIFIITVGEEITFRTIGLLKEHTPEYGVLTVWYDACGRGVKEGFVHRLKKETDDVIISDKNHGIKAAIQFGLMNTESDYMLFSAADTLVVPGYFERLEKPFKEVNRLAFAGEGYCEFPEDYIINDLSRGVDGVTLISMDAVDEIGGIQNSLGFYCHEFVEWQHRTIRKGWNFATVKDVNIHGGTQHEGRNQLPNLIELMDQNKDLMRQACRAGSKQNWWGRKIKAELSFV